MPRVQILREVRLFALLDHPSIVRYYSAWIEVQEQPASLRSSAASQTPPDDKANRVARIRSLSEAADELEDGSDEAWSPMFAAQISAEGLSSQSIDDDDDDDDVEEEDEEEKEEDDDDNDNDGSGDDHHGDEATMPKTREPRSQKAPASPNTHLLRMTLYIQMEVRRKLCASVGMGARNERATLTPRAVKDDRPRFVVRAFTALPRDLVGVAPAAQRTGLGGPGPAVVRSPAQRRRPCRSLAHLPAHRARRPVPALAEPDPPRHQATGMPCILLALIALERAPTDRRNRNEHSPTAERAPFPEHLLPRRRLGPPAQDWRLWTVQ